MKSFFMDYKGLFIMYSQDHDARIRWHQQPWYWPSYTGNSDNKVHGANMGPIWGWQDPGGPHVGPTNLCNQGEYFSFSTSPCLPWGGISVSTCAIPVLINDRKYTYVFILKQEKTLQPRYILPVHGNQPSMLFVRAEICWRQLWRVFVTHVY